jgi:hypothetical protein
MEKLGIHSSKVLVEECQRVAPHHSQNSGPFFCVCAVVGSEQSQVTKIHQFVGNNRNSSRWNA